MAKARHYEIENNRVYEVEQVREKVGIIAKGFDFLDNEVVINNIDAGDAKALFKIARYGAKKKSNIGVVTIILGTVITGIAFIVIYMGFARYGGTEDITLPNVLETPIQEQQTAPIPFVDKEQEENKKNELEELEKSKILESKYESEGLRMQNQFLIESSSIELQKKDLEISRIQQEKNELTGEINTIKKRETELIAELEKQIVENKTLVAIIFDFESNKNSRAGIIMQVGEYIDNLCRENNTQECKDMYFNLLKK